ncbi:hypothetical protein PN462_08415 [Spirulina sp. CS-785/01]|uniref:hypothetical protein n=1 Tax=Spirulina sp. CS-785/01 TaxID=3021716 RepID=UPI00232D99DE|nr:hypothetical protein [Spirulina sp. CS-785/01]MDB9313122.1 hypothetical protein [Spirulina sp. CS-785/01]
MADGDIIPGQPTGYYRTLYERLCEGKAELPKFTWDVMGALREDIKRKGDQLIDLAKRMGIYLMHAIENGETNYATLRRELEHIKNRCQWGADSDKELVFRAGKSIIHSFRYGELEEIKSIPELIIGQYMEEVYKSNFESRINPNVKHYADADVCFLNEYIQSIRSDIIKVARGWSKKLNQGKSVNQIKRPRRNNIKTIDMGENLL